MNKKELMKKAHEITREIKAEYPEVDYKFQLGLCLSYLMKGNDNMLPELKGTSKQIAWAEKIRKEMLENIEKKAENLKTQKENAVTKMLNKNLNALKERISVETDVKFYINNNDNTENTHAYSIGWGK